MTQVQQKVADFFAAYPQRQYDARELILRADEPVPDVFYLLEGRVSQYDITSTGNEVVVNVFKPGAFFPMSAALNDAPNQYFFEASTAVHLQVAPAADAVAFLEANPDVALDLLRRVYRGVDGVLRRMAHLMGGDARSRLLFELLNAAYRFGQSQPAGPIVIPLTEGDVARHSGLARETVNRTLQKLKSDKLIDVTPQGIVMTDAHRLEQLLGDEI